MKFYDRENELNILKSAGEFSLTSSKMTIITGRRRIGKTRLISEFCSGADFIYLFVARKNEPLLCKEFIEEIMAKTGIPVFGEINTFKNIFGLLLEYAQNHPLTLVIDEFQEFIHINPAVFSEMQNLWDQYKNKSRMNLIISGSVYSLMKKIFENAKEPLFGRADERIILKPFSVIVLRNILADNYPRYSNRDLLAFFILTGGVAKYVELLSEKKAFTLNKILDQIFRENSLFIDEGKNVLIEEFGKEYSTYFSILSLVASSKTSRTEVESILQKNIGGYLDRLENEYTIIRKVKPVFSKPGSRSQKYEIEDNFLNFWFRFIYKYRSAIEIGNYSYVKSIVHRDFSTYSGKFLEKYFCQKLALTKQFSLIGSYWDRNAENEIDIIAINEMNRRVLVAEVKLDKNKINMSKLKEKASNLPFLKKGYKTDFIGLSVEDMQMVL
ncbi:MAG: ATP-binding protein [Bacteroidetes bacterium]|nr:ATP-binding protein [Bacteroidota bacterium]